MSLSARIMNVQPPAGFDSDSTANERYGYGRGHRDARHAAAELADEADAIRDELVAALEVAQEALRWMSDCYVGEDDEAGECASCHERSYKPHAPDCKKTQAIAAINAAIARAKGQA